MIATGIGLAVAGCLGLLVAERTHAPWRIPAKLLASAGFLLVAIGAGVDGSYATWIFIGLALSWVGDTALLGTSDRAFLLGLVSFLLGHVAYVVAFAGLPPEATPVAIALAVAWVGAAIAVGRWLLPSVDGPMRVPHRPHSNRGKGSRRAGP